jgi:hypothetical protein
MWDGWNWVPCIDVMNQGPSTPCLFLGLSRSLSEILCFPGSRRPSIHGQALIILRAARKTYFKNSAHRNGRNSSRRVLQASSPTPGSSEGAVGAHAVAAGPDTDEKFFKYILHLTRLKTKHNCSMWLPRHPKACPSTVGGSQRDGVCIAHSSGSDQIQAAKRGLSYHQQLQTRLRDKSS